MNRIIALGAAVVVIGGTLWTAEHYLRSVGAQQSAVMTLQSDGPTFNGAKVTAVGVIPVYDLTGAAISGVRCAQGTVTSASGAWTAGYSGMNFTSVTKVNVFAMSPNTTLAGAYTATLTSFSATAAAGNVVTGTTLAVLNTYSLALGTSPVSVFVQVCGT